MTAPFANISGIEILSGEIIVPFGGAWFAELVMADVLTATGRVTIEVGDLSLSGTVDTAATGTRGEQTFARIVGGAGGWSTPVGPQHYHADNGVRALLVAQDAARAAGETLGTVTTSNASLGADYVRQSGPASRAFEAALGEVGWWVDFDGITQTGTRPSTNAAPDSYDMIEFDPRRRTATLALDNLSAVGIGTILSDGFDTPHTVRDFTIKLDPDSVRIIAWVGTVEAPRGRLTALLESIVESVLDRRAYGTHRYRVIRMSGDRVELQPVRRDLGLPDIVPASMWPGVAGVHATLVPGCEVLVTFVDGDRSQPVIVGFVGKGGPGANPLFLDFFGSTSFLAVATNIDLALNAFASAVPAAGDGGAAIHTAFTGAWPPGSSCKSAKLRTE